MPSSALLVGNVTSCSSNQNQQNCSARAAKEHKPNGNVVRNGRSGAVCVCGRLKQQAGGVSVGQVAAGVRGEMPAAR